MVNRNPPPSPRDPIAELLGDHRELLKQVFPLPPKRRSAVTDKTRRRVSLGCALLALAGTVYWSDPAYQQATYQSPVESRQEVLLADGSTLMLDRASELRVTWHLRSRRSELLRGQAYFAVAHQAWRPFSVSAGVLAVEVLGTSFNLKRDRDSSEVLVASGRVAVHAGKESLELRPGQGLRLDARGERQVKVLDPALVGAWRHGRRVFDQTPLAEALGEWPVGTGPQLKLLGAAGDLQISGVFDENQRDAFIALLPQILPLQLQRLPDGSWEAKKIFR